MEESILMWNRLENSLRNENQIDKALRFEIRDPLWMLTRQWQFGELDGEDAGTLAFANIKGEQSPIKGIGGQTHPMQEFDVSNMPFEFALEHEAFNPDIAQRLEMGRHWERILTKRLPANNAKTVINQFRNNTRFQFNAGVSDEPDRAGLFQHAQKYSDENYLLLLRTVKNSKIIDGFILIQELRSGKLASVFLPQNDDKVNAAGKEFLQWFERIYGQLAVENSWHPQHLEYQPQLAFVGSTGQTRVLRKEEYFGDGIEWHGFSPKPTWDGQANATLSVDARKITNETVIPSAIRFRGMPSQRLWEMEDAQVDFGSIRATSTELSKMLFAEFGLVYGNDWLIAPVQFSCNSLCRVSEIIVTDVFGRETVLNETPPIEDWAFFQTQVSENGKRWLFLANGNELVQESKPIEKVLFMRDEMSNMIWGVEEIISSPLGGGRSGETLAKQTTELVRSLDNKEVAATEGTLSSAGWKYKAGTLMAENRIPFIPMAVSNAQSLQLEKRRVVLQRAAIPRVSDEFQPVRIRPRTSLLGYQGKGENEKLPSLLLFEEEVPRAGMELSLIWKRTRWYNGQTITWLSRKKKMGKGEIDANFRFDSIVK